MISDKGEATGEPRVLLVSPPWTTLGEPSLGLGILKSVLTRRGITCRVLHLNLFSLEFLRRATYSSVAEAFGLNDFMFSGILDPDVSPHQRRNLREQCETLVARGSLDDVRFGGLDGLVDRVLQIRGKVIPDWVDRYVAEMLDWSPTLVGFTCMFDQTIPSVAIAKRLKDLAATAPMVALGGYAVRSPTGQAVLEAFPWVDTICLGEGEPAIVPLATASLGAGTGLSGIPNILYRRDDGRAVESSSSPMVRMDDVPDPDFDDFYLDIARTTEQFGVSVSIDRLPIENSRGCWWGAKHHCVFCGIHDADLGYRHRSAERVIASMDSLHRRYGATAFRFADYILPANYYRTLLPQLTERGAPYDLKCELKANVDEAKARALAAAGFREVQPGVESFSSAVLKAMDKGVTGAQNVYLLVLARRFGIVALYNMLYGLPDDQPADYRLMINNLRRLRHLAPPSSYLRILVTRFAPLHSDPERFGLESAHHAPEYDVIFSEAFLMRSGFDLDAYCYIFDHPFEPSRELQELYSEIDRICHEWIRTDGTRTPVVMSESLPSGQLSVRDTRDGEEIRRMLTRVQSSVLERLERPLPLARLVEMCARIGEAEVRQAVADLDALELVFDDGERIVSLVIPSEGSLPPRHWWDNYERRFQKDPPTRFDLDTPGVGVVPTVAEAI